MVLYSALFCACPTVAAATIASAAAPTAHEGCQGHEQPGATDAPQPHDHGSRCECSGAAGVLEAPPVPTVAAPLPLVLPPTVALLIDRLLAELPTEVISAGDAASDERPLGVGADGPLLRQRCALNL